MMEYKRLTIRNEQTQEWDFENFIIETRHKLDWCYNEIGARLCELEDKIEQGTLINIKEVAKLFAHLWDAPCDYGLDNEEVIEVILKNTDYNWCERNCNTNDYALCWEQYIKAKLKELQE